MGGEVPGTSEEGGGGESVLMGEVTKRSGTHSFVSFILCEGK